MTQETPTPETPPVKTPETPPVKTPETPPVKTPETPTVETPEATPKATPEVTPETPKEDPEVAKMKAELEELRALKAAQETAKEEARRAKLEREQLLQEDLEKAKTQASELARKLALAEAGVPQEILALVPKEGYEEFLGSDAYQTLKGALEKSKTVSEPSPTTPPVDPTPTEKKGSVEAPRTFGNISYSALSDFGKLF